jgi:hypothetical protein
VTAQANLYFALEGAADAERWRLILISTDSTARFMNKLVTVLGRSIMRLGAQVSVFRLVGEKTSRYGPTEVCLTGKLIAPREWCDFGPLHADAILSERENPR